MSPVTIRTISVRPHDHRDDEAAVAERLAAVEAIE